MMAEGDGIKIGWNSIDDAATARQHRIGLPHGIECPGEC